MNEKPILFSRDMVSAIFYNRKTQTRRLAKGVPDNHYFQSLVHHASGRFTWAPNDKSPIADSDIVQVNAPYNSGDVLWVREEHRIHLADGFVYCQYDNGTVSKVAFKDLSLKTLNKLKRRKTLGKWQRARFLPKELARIWLRVTKLTVERLADISFEDAVNEGIASAGMHGWKDYTKENTFELTAPNSFLSLWEKLHGKKSLDANPWVWVVDFEEISKTGKPEKL